LSILSTFLKNQWLTGGVRSGRFELLPFLGIFKDVQDAQDTHTPQGEHLPKVGILEGGIRLFLDCGKTHGGECAAKAQWLKAVMAGGRNWDVTRRTAAGAG
jgi:hypothetical protein